MEKIIGKRIREMRKKRGLTQDDLAHALGMKRANISNYERGLANVPSTTLYKLADIFNTSADYLLGRTDNPEPIGIMDQFDTIAAHRSDDPAKELPKEARESLESFMEHILRKHGLIE